MASGLCDCDAAVSTEYPRAFVSPRRTYKATERRISSVRASIADRGLHSKRIPAAITQGYVDCLPDSSRHGGLKQKVDVVSDIFMDAFIPDAQMSHFPGDLGTSSIVVSFELDLARGPKMRVIRKR